jgi:hypothetical protein
MLRNRVVVSVMSLLAISTLMGPFQMSSQDSGCTFTGHSACGGDDHGQCAPHQRYFSEKCANGATYNKCLVDDYCANTSKGRFHIGGGWRGGAYQILQRGDSFSISGGAAGPATGSFTGANTIVVTWPQAHATFNGVISGNGVEATLIRWDHPANNVWNR